MERIFFGFVITLVTSVMALAIVVILVSVYEAIKAVWKKAPPVHVIILTSIIISMVSYLLWLIGGLFI